MQIVPWVCALGDAPPVTLPVAATVAIAPPDDSVDTNKIIISGNGTISSFGATAPLVTKDVTFNPTGGTITLVNSAQLVLLGGSNRIISAQSFAKYASDGLGHWQEISFSSSTTGAVTYNLYTSSQTLTIPQNCSKAFVRMTGPGGPENPSFAENGGNGGYLEKWLNGLVANKTLVLTVGDPVSLTATTLVSGTQTIST